jgi:hypothetical protein
VEAQIPPLPAAEAAALFSEVESLRAQVIELQADNVRWQNAHKVAMNEREYWFKKWNALYEQHRAK